MKLDFLAEYDFFTGVPDSQLKPLCDFLIDKYDICKNHIIAANEGNSAAIAAGYHLATGKVPVVYLQNSGIGNIINPLASLMNENVYAIPCIFIVGWRGEPDVKDEPQHIYQGAITLKLFEDMGVETFVVGKSTTKEELLSKFESWEELLKDGRQVALIVRKDALSFEKTAEYKNENTLSREQIIEHITAQTAGDPIISTTGKASRELFEIRERRGEGHQYDFLTVGSMGHASSIALGVALQKPSQKIWCIDGDGAALMHMGALAVIGGFSPDNLVHIVINNSAHETVGGMPTVASKIDFVMIAKACGYKHAICVDNADALDLAIKTAKEGGGLTFIEVKCSIGSRANLGRPTTTAKENKANFMSYLGGI